MYTVVMACTDELHCKIHTGFAHLTQPSSVVERLKGRCYLQSSLDVYNQLQIIN
jgi:hypothetical protein